MLKRKIKEGVEDAIRIGGYSFIQSSEERPPWSGDQEEVRDRP